MDYTDDPFNSYQEKEQIDFYDGDRVMISEISPTYAQKRNLYSDTMWTKTHMALLGHVGYVQSSDLERRTAVVRVYYVMPPGTELLHSLTEWPFDALQYPNTVDHSKGDLVAITRGDPDKTSLGVISAKDIVNFGGIPKYLVYLKNTGNSMSMTREIQVTVDVNPGWKDGRRDLFLCPIYTGPRLSMVMRDLNEQPIHTYKTTIHGFKPEHLMSIVANWTEDSVSYSKLVESIRAGPQQICGVFDGDLPLFRAVSDGHWSVVVMLISLGADKNVRDHREWTIIHVAADVGNDKMLEGVLNLLPKDVHRPDAEGDTPLHLAARHAHAACIDRLLTVSSVLPSVPNIHGDTPLHEVCKLPESGNKKATISRILTNSRASIHQMNNMSMTPLQISIFEGHVSTIEQLLQLRSSCRNTTTKHGMNALHYAASCGHVNVVNKLIMLGLEVHRRDKFGRGVLHYAVEKWTGEAEKDRGRLATIQALVKAGAPSNVVDLHGQTPIFQLVRDIVSQNEIFPTSLAPVCAQLVRTNLNLDEMASRLRPNWQLATACFLVANGADLSVKDRKGFTVSDICETSTVRSIIVHLAQMKQRQGAGMPLIVLNEDTFDAAEVTMCTFSCLDSVATVKLSPCGHSVACVDCAEKTAIRRCPVCYQFISGAQDQNELPVQIGCRSNESIEYDRKNTELSAAVCKKIAEDAAREAKIEVEREKQKELNILKEKLEQLELETSCAICMDNKIAIVFNCGHTACAECADKLNKQCHICRKPIETRQCIYS